MADNKGVLFVPYKDTLGLLSVEDALQGLRGRLPHARARQRGAGRTRTASSSTWRTDFHNHWHVKSAFLKDVPTTGVRIYNYYDDGVRNTVGGLDCTRYIVLSDPHSGKPLAIVDEHWSYAVRSAAAAAIACKWVGPSNPEGARARRHRHHGHEFAALPLDHVQVRGNPLHLAAARDARRRSREQWSQELGIPVMPKDTIEEVVRGADIAVGGTTSGEIVSREEWLKPGCTFISLARRELDPAGWSKMDKVVIDTWEFNMLQPEFKRMVEVRPVLARAAPRGNPGAGVRREDRAASATTSAS